MKDITERQKEVISFITKYKKEHPYSPFVREIADHFSISVKAAYDRITALKRKGYIKFADKRPRTMELMYSDSEESAILAEIPILGTVAAGQPILAEENFDGNIMLHRSMLKKNKKYFALRVKGESMSGAGILDGDMAVIEKQNTVHNGDIAGVGVDDAVTLTR
ncbi:MAG: transcriptional repressor LexA, partial [Treponema sp.]|nr:transcriptional repressor LexA [Treponema sp.]